MLSTAKICQRVVRNHKNLARGMKYEVQSFGGLNGLPLIQSTFMGTIYTAELLKDFYRVDTVIPK